MVRLTSLFLLLLPHLNATTACMGQSAHAADVEVIQPPAMKPEPDPKKPDVAAAARMAFEQTNAFRKEGGVGALKVNARLTRTAADFAAYMAQKDRFGHTADDQHPADRVKKHDYDYCIVLENIAYLYDSGGIATADLADGFVGGWKKSPGHRRNMLDPDVTETGIAIARSENTGYYYAVQLFGRPKSQMIEFAVSNRSGAAINYKVDKESFALEPGQTRTHERCRPPTLNVPRSSPKKESAADGHILHPASGDRYVISEDSGNFIIKKQ